MTTVFLELSFKVAPLQPATEILMAELAQFPFDSFEETTDGLKAYIKKEDYQTRFLEEIQVLSHPNFTFSYEIHEIQQENWNANWEAQFEAITIGTDCRVRAPFHTNGSEVKYDIVIMPKMSFGTGHHETTHMMLEHLLEQRVEGLFVLDMGCGTGVLAILAAMMGASYIDAIDIDPWSYLNAKENAERNNQTHINVAEGDSRSLGKQQYDIVLANINRNILLSDIPVYCEQLKDKGRLILSGYYENDQEIITDVCQQAGLELIKESRKNNWVSAVYEL